MIKYYIFIAVFAILSGLVARKAIPYTEERYAVACHSDEHPNLSLTYPKLFDIEFDDSSM
ncbi:MAG: hypothetical protein K6A23_01125 [Butyrivibrio sp.]|nr:hypothetical protein [Butyrivibrio sp.]